MQLETGQMIFLVPWKSPSLINVLEVMMVLGNGRHWQTCEPLEADGCVASGCI